MTEITETEAEALWGSAYTLATQHVIKDDRPLCGSKVRKRGPSWFTQRGYMLHGCQREAMCERCRRKLAADS